MTNSNSISLSIPVEIVEQVKQLYGQANQLLAPYLVNLTPDDRVQLPKMGEKTIPFVTKGNEYLKVPGTPVPPYVDIPELEIDIKAFETLRQILQVIQPTVDMLDDTMLLCGSEAYIAVLAFYTYLKGAAKANVPGAKTIYDDLGIRFPGRPAKKEKTE